MKKLFLLLVSSLLLVGILLLACPVRSAACTKCSTLNVNRKCGKNNCGGFLESVKTITSPTDANKYRITFKCKKCGHTFIVERKNTDQSGKTDIVIVEEVKEGQGGQEGHNN